MGLNRVAESKDLGMSLNNLHKNRLARDSHNDQTAIFYNTEARNQTLRRQPQGNCAHLCEMFFDNKKIQNKFSTV